MDELEKWKAVNATRSIQELQKLLDKMGPIEISGGRGAYDMGERLREVNEQGWAVNRLTRNYGIRQQYLFLYETTE